MYIGWQASVEKFPNEFIHVVRMLCDECPMRWTLTKPERKLQFELFLQNGWHDSLKKKQKKTTEILLCIFWLGRWKPVFFFFFFFIYFQFQQPLLSIERERKNSGGCAILSLVYSSSSWMPWELDFQNAELMKTPSESSSFFLFSSYFNPFEWFLALLLYSQVYSHLVRL